MTAAAYLARSGQKILLIEKNTEFGGLVNSFKRDGFQFEAGVRALEDAGMKEIYNVAHGFEGDLDDSHHRNSHNGWRFDGLPWAQT